MVGNSKDAAAPLRGVLSQVTHMVAPASPTIKVLGPWASLHGVIPALVLEKLFVVPDPQRFHNRAFKDGRWDGMIRLYEGNRFPAGCVDRVVQYLRSEGHAPKVLAPKEAVLDLKPFSRKYLPKVTLWDNQLEACLAFFTHSRSCIESGTGSGKSFMIAAAALFYWQEYDLRSVVMTSKKGLARQLSRGIQQVYGSDWQVGQMGDGVKTLGDFLTVGTAATLISFRDRIRSGTTIPADVKVRKAVTEADVLFIDEAHHAGSAPTWYEIAMACPARRRHGLSGTLPEVDGVDELRLIGATGPVVYRAPAKNLVAQGRLSRPKIAVVMHELASHPELPWKYADRWDGYTRRSSRVKQFDDGYATAYAKAVMDSARHNRAVVRAAVWCVNHGRRVALLCRRRPHWMRLRQMLEQTGVPFAAAWGATDTGSRDAIKKRFESGDIKIVLATTILDEGEDWPSIDCIVLAEGVKKAIPTLQRVGRGMRRQKGGPPDLWVVDFASLAHPTVTSHAIDRTQAYEGAGYETLVWEHWTDSGEDPHLLPFPEWDKHASPVVAA